MFCGSCMHDNTLARALKETNIEVTLIPTYTPIRVDEDNVSIDEVYLGGINVYLDTVSGVWRSLPRFVKRIVDKPWIIRLATRFGVSNDAKQLGKLTIAMLQGADGPQKQLVKQLVDFISEQLRPDVVIFSNALLVGVLPSLKQKYSGKVYCVLQGDDIFLEDLQEPFQSQSLQLISKRSQSFDGFMVHSDYYRDFMADYLSLDAGRFKTVPLGIDFEGFDGLPVDRHNEQFTVGYFARICPEKGLDQLINAFKDFHQQNPASRLKVAGYSGSRNAEYLQSCLEQADDLGDAFQFIGELADRKAKAQFLSSLDVLSVPTVYREPKGLYVLESLANGTPVVQPDHGSFPELIGATEGGLLFQANHKDALIQSLIRMQDRELRLRHAKAGHAKVRELFSQRRMANNTLVALGIASSTE